jgi:hypothetical protein
MTQADRPALQFIHLNRDWNAEPNAPAPKVEQLGTTIALRFYLNPFQFPEFSVGAVGCLSFTGCSRWRLGSTNDEGWYMGQCRYSGIAPGWGEFYEVVGEDGCRDQPDDWRTIGTDAADGRHFLFYLRDETFECIALAWSFSSSPPSR